MADVPDSEYASRLDLRNERIFSIDPPTARDLDDAVSIKLLDDGTYELGVHIADVSYFIAESSPLDIEASQRGTSVYLVQKVIPMLPRRLCEDLCSLNPDVDRLAFSVHWNVDIDGNFIGEPRFARSLIRSCAKLSYDHAQMVIDGKSWKKVPGIFIGNSMDMASVRNDIVLLYNLSKTLRQKRFENGSLTLKSHRLWFDMDDLGNPVGCGIYQIKEANRLIEEFMLLANIAVSHQLAMSFPEQALLRCHPPPLPQTLLDLASSLAVIGIKLDTTSAKTLNASFEAIENPRHRDLIRSLAVKKMKRAAYFCAGSKDLSQYSHYALGVPLYTHFTYSCIT